MAEKEKNGNRSSKKTTLYRMIYDDLKAKILNRIYSDGDRIPFERELCEEYGVERITARKALELLVADGLLEKRPGLGSFVRLPKLSNGQSASRNILFVMAKNQNDISENPSAFNSGLFYAIEEECRNRSYSLIYAVLDEKGDLRDLINENTLAGILFVSYIPKGILDQCVQMRIPAICLNNRHEKMISIVPENEAATYKAVMYLQEQGHRKIGILLGRRDYYSTIERFKGYSAAINAVTPPVDPRYVLEGDWTFDGARNAILEMLSTLGPDELPTAIFCCSDMMAIGAMDALKEKNLSIPRDISVMGFDNIQQSLHVYPRLSTVSADIKLMAKLAVERIIKYEETVESGGYLIMIPASIEQRQSVGKI